MAKDGGGEGRPPSEALMRHLSHLLEQPQSHQRLFEDKVFTFQDWNGHRNATWRHRVEPVVFGRVALGFIWQLVLVAFASLAVCLWQQLIVPLGAPGVQSGWAAPFTLTSFALSLLLVFKTNSSYSRWWEGRVTWGQIVNYGRNLARLLLVYACGGQDSPQTPLQQDMMAVAMRWIAASVHILRGHLREATSARCEEQAAHLLTFAEREYLRRRWPNRPLGAAHVISWVCGHRALGLSDMQQMVLQEQVSLFVNMSGACERIQRTAIPSAYTRHTSRFINVFIVCSPLMLWPSIGWSTMVVAPMIAFLLLGTENIGVQIEEPFRVLALDAICKAIESNVQDIARAYDLMEPHQTLGTMAPTPLHASRPTSAHGGNNNARHNTTTILTTTATTTSSKPPGGLQQTNGGHAAGPNGGLAEAGIPGHVPEWDLVAVLGLSHHAELANSGSVMVRQARAAARQQAGRAGSGLLRGGSGGGVFGAAGGGGGGGLLRGGSGGIGGGGGGGGMVKARAGEGLAGAGGESSLHVTPSTQGEVPGEQQQGMEAAVVHVAAPLEAQQQQQQQVGLGSGPGNGVPGGGGGRGGPGGDGSGHVVIWNGAFASSDAR